MKTKNSEYQIAVIQKIKKMREERGISQSVMGNIIGISPGQIGNIESPKFIHKYTLRQIYTFCEFVKCPFEQIFLKEEEMIDVDYVKLLIRRIVEYDE